MTLAKEMHTRCIGRSFPKLLDHDGIHDLGAEPLRDLVRGIHAMNVREQVVEPGVSRNPVSPQLTSRSCGPFREPDPVDLSEPGP